MNFSGKHFTYENAIISPLPAQKPLPAWIGGSSTGAIRRTVKYGTGWLAGIQTPQEVGPVTAKIKAASAESDRTIDDDQYGAGFPFRFGSWDEPIIQKSLAGYQRAGEGIRGGWGEETCPAPRRHGRRGHRGADQEAHRGSASGGAEPRLVRR